MNNNDLDSPLLNPPAETWAALSTPERRALHAVLRRSRSAKNINDVHERQRTTGQRVADAIAGRMGSWPFIIIQSIILAAWIAGNTLGFSRHWDPYPYILLNLALSFQAAYAAPIIMMSQNRQASKDRLGAEQDYEVNLRAELEIAALTAKLDQLANDQWTNLIELQQRQLTMLSALTSDQEGLDCSIP